MDSDTSYKSSNMADGEAADWVSETLADAPPPPPPPPPSECFYLIPAMFCACLALKYFVWGMRTLVNREPEGAAELKAEIQELKVELKTLSPMADFVKMSKKERLVIKLEKKLRVLTGESASSAEQTPEEQLAAGRRATVKTALKYGGGPMSEVFVSTAIVFIFWGSKVLRLPSQWLLPVGLWGWLVGDTSTYISVVFYTAMCMRVSGRLFTALHPNAGPKFDLTSLRKSVLGF